MLQIRRATAVVKQYASCCSDKRRTTPFLYHGRQWSPALWQTVEPRLVADSGAPPCGRQWSPALWQTVEPRLVADSGAPPCGRQWSPALWQTVEPRLVADSGALPCGHPQKVDNLITRTLSNVPTIPSS